jgi:uncharacterized protein DUF6152
MRTPGTFGLLVGGLCALVTPLLAHHEWPADQTRPITIHGTVTEVRWANPHVMIYLDVDANGTIDKWTVGGSSPQFMTTCGWNKKTLQPGDVVTVTGYRFKDGSYAARMRTTVLPNGKEMYYGSPPHYEALCGPPRR